MLSSTGDPAETVNANMNVVQIYMNKVFSSMRLNYLGIYNEKGLIRAEDFQGWMAEGQEEADYKATPSTEQSGLGTPLLCSDNALRLLYN